MYGVRQNGPENYSSFTLSHSGIIRDLLCFFCDLMMISKTQMFIFFFCLKHRSK